jgi:ATP-dependent Clp protease adaptor protein ClpS
MSTNHFGKPLEEEDVLVEEQVEKESNLVLYNDDVNTFDWVIDSLVKVCRHHPEQAEQCSYIVHYSGRCAVKEGSFQDLRPMREALVERGLNATIE